MEGVEVQNMGGFFQLFGVHIPVGPKEVNQSSNVVTDIPTNGSTSSAVVPDIRTNVNEQRLPSSSAVVPDIRTTGHKRQHSSSAVASDIRKNAKLKKERSKLRFSNDELEKISNEHGVLPNEITETIIERLQIQPSEIKKPKLLMVKILSVTDMKSSQSRLLIPRNIIKDLNFVNEQEQKMLHENGGKVEVNVFYKDREENIVNLMSNLGRWPLAKRKTAKKVERVEENATKQVERVEDNATKQVKRVEDNATKHMERVEDNATEVERVEENATKQVERVEDNATMQVERVEENATKVERVEEKGENSINRWNYVVQKTWIKIMNASKLEVEDVVQLWWFRYGDGDEKLGLVLLKVDV